MSGMVRHPGEVKSAICIASPSLLVDGVIELNQVRTCLQCTSPFMAHRVI
jgi:hypothetical protein